MFPSDILPSLYPKEIDYDDIEEILNSNIFNVMLNRRSQRKFEDKEIETWKIEIIFAGPDIRLLLQEVFRVLKYFIL